MMPKSMAPMEIQVCRDAAQIEQEERAQQRERHYCSDHERGAVVAHAEEEHEHEQDQGDAFDHVVPHGVQCPVDQIGPVVMGHEVDARREVVFVDVFDLGAHALEYFERVLALAQNDDALDHVVFIGLAGHNPADAAQADLVADFHTTEIADADGRAVARIDRDRPNVRGVAHETEAAHDVHLGSVLDVAAAAIAVAIGKGVEHLAEGKIVGTQFGGIDQHLVLFGRTAEAVHVHHAWHGAHLPFDDPVFQGFQLNEWKALGRGERVAVDFAHGCRIRRKTGVGARRKIDRGERLGGLVAHKLAVGVVLEDDGDL